MKTIAAKFRELVRDSRRSPFWTAPLQTTGLNVDEYTYWDEIQGAKNKLNDKNKMKSSSAVSPASCFQPEVVWIVNNSSTGGPTR